MLFAIDVGNTNIVLGIYRGDELVASWRLATRKENTSDEYGVLIDNLFRQARIDPKDISAVILSSVVPPLVSTFIKLAKAHFHQEALVVGPGIKTGMPILYDNPREVGADRIVNTVAAFHKYGRALIVVDFGTATTFDLLSSRGEYLGGAIAPGIGISMDALFSRTAKLPRVEFRNPGSVVGKNTIHSMQSGIYFGYVGMVDAIVERMKAISEEGCVAVATGGLAPLIATESKSLDAVEENLTLDGLKIIYQMNIKSP